MVNAASHLLVMLGCWNDAFKQLNVISQGNKGMGVICATKVSGIPSDEVVRGLRMILGNIGANPVFLAR